MDLKSLYVKRCKKQSLLETFILWRPVSVFCKASAILGEELLAVLNGQHCVDCCNVHLHIGGINVDCCYD